MTYLIRNGLFCFYLACFFGFYYFFYLYIYLIFFVYFLLSLFFCLLLLILFKKIPAFLSISIAIIIGLLIGYIDDVGSAFSLSRTFAFFPFFLTGYFLTKKHFVFLKKPTMRIITLSI